MTRVAGLRSCRVAVGSSVQVAVMVALLAAWPPDCLTAQGQYPTQPPAPTGLRPVRFPPFVTARLANGTDVIVVEHHEQPVVTISLSLPAGGFYEPADRAGLAELVADLLTKGTERRTADHIAAEIEGAGGGIGAGAGEDYLTVTVSALAENVPLAMDVLADVVARSTFPASEVTLTRTRSLSALQLALSQPAQIASRIFGREVYGDHPYGRSATPASLRAITRDDVVRFYSERVKPTGALLVVAGDVRAADVRQLAERAFAGWTGAAAPAPAAAAIPARTGTEIVLVHKPGAVQSNIVAGYTFITPRDPALYPLVIVNRILGAGADSRLFMVLREQKGWTYDAHSNFSRPRGVGAFQATTQVRTEVTDSALGELLRQLEAIRTESPADSEITAAKNFLVGSFPLSIETPEQIARQVANARLRGLPDDYVIRFRERLAAVTLPQIQSAARRFMTTDRMVIVVVGDGTRVLNGLKALGAVRLVDVEGRPMAEADLSPRAGGLAWEQGRLTAGTSTYRVVVQGNPFGEVTRGLERTSEGSRAVLRVVGTTVLGPIVRQSDTLTMDAATFRPIRFRQGGTVQGQPTFVNLDYEGTRVRGQARVPQPPAGGLRELNLDTALAEGTYDSHQLPALLLALPLAGGARWTIPVFSGEEGSARMFAVSVAGEDSVTVPAGSFATWRVEVTGGPVPITFYLTKEAPYAIVKYELVGAPFVFELTGRN